MKLEEEVKKLVPECFYQWIYVSRKEKVYSLLRKERKDAHKFIQEQLRKRYIKPSKSSQIALVFFVEKNDGKKRVVLQP